MLSISGIFVENVGNSEAYVGAVRVVYSGK
jgi:hypothetical protein